ncbi:MAG: hypothetical protein IJ649_10900 [Oscillospiraceae bacterium]|nr:hypothetical protein [Oscillospiraceae bacterium]
MNKRRLAFRLGAIALLIAIAACMMVVGRGHTVYVDNKSIDFDGETYAPYYRATVYVNGERLSKLQPKERTSATNIGQSFSMTLELIKEKGGETETVDIALKLPYNMDGIIVNIPGYMAGLPEEAWMTEFVSTPTEAEMQDEEIPTDEEDVLAGAEF